MGRSAKNRDPPFNTIHLDQKKVKLLKKWRSQSPDLNIIENEQAISILSECGVGSCGPRAFYGTLGKIPTQYIIECHLQLEEEFALFMGAEAAILYSYSCSVIISVLPSCIHSDDDVFLDESCSQWIAFGAKTSRGRIHFYRHHDWGHLEQLLAASLSPGKFIVAEGVNQKHMDIPDLPTLIRLKYRYKARIILDESYSIGVINQRGLTQLFECDVDHYIMTLTDFPN
ncbi:serine palmitoyltransferase 1-like [Octopus sinensis]|uniref:Serine palmitoyltransferase 1 n=1 Tax=Octopus sinensis TaxID=2607531 RepID=A0A6P7U0C4_9MOLL|nr:serine palmitoyltransferase 1-like [Octopus sinensis]